MPKVVEAELNSWQAGTCIICNENAGDVLLCGEGYACTSCVSDASGLDEAAVFDQENITSTVKAKVKQVLNFKRGGDES